MHPLVITSTLFAWSLVACAGPRAAQIQPGHPSATGEEQTARERERSAGVLERQAELEEDQIECGPLFERELGSVCWSSPRESGAAAEDLARANELRDAAKRHRRVSKALRDAEARACTDVPESDIITSPFAHRADIVGVDVIRGAAAPDGQPRILGARVRFHRVERLSAQWLQHLVDCQLARDDALGHDVPELSYCPLVPSGAVATVTTIPHGYVIEVRSDDPSSASEIARRATALMQ